MDTSTNFSVISKKQNSLVNLPKFKIKFFIPILIGAAILTGVIYYTYQYLATGSRASANKVTYQFQVGNCKTERPTDQKRDAATCEISGNTDQIVTILLNLNSQGNKKMSGVDFIFNYNRGNPGHLEYIPFPSGSPSLAFDKVLLQETRNSTYGDILHLTLVNTGGDNVLKSNDVVPLKFKVKRNGDSRLMLIDSATTVVGPEGQLSFDLVNDISTRATDSFNNTFNVRISTTGTITGGPTPNLTTTGIPISAIITPPVTPSISVTPGDDAGANIKNITLNMKFKIQGVTALPRNASPLEFEVRLAQGRSVYKTERVSLTPQADGTYTGSKQISNVNIAPKYNIQVKGAKHLRKIVCTLNPRETVPGTYKCETPSIQLVEGANNIDFSNIYMLAGDLPLQNGILDSTDIAFIRQNFGSNSEADLARGDLNFDGIVDTQDYALVISALAFKYDEGL